MSIAPKNKAERENIAALAQEHFRAFSWTVNAIKSDPTAFSVESGEVKLSVLCLDSEIHQFYSAVAIIEAIARRAREIRHWRHTQTISVLPFHIPGIVVNTAAENGVYFFTLEELAFITDLPSFFDRMPSGLQKRETMLMQGILPLCLSIVDRFQKAGDRASAINWVRGTIDQSIGYTTAYKVLFTLLLEVHEYEGAATVGHQALQADPNNLFFLSSMKSLAENHKVCLDNEDWQTRIARVKRHSGKVESESLEGMLRRQAGTVSQGEVKIRVPSESSLSVSRPIWQLVRRLLVR
jgi:hypothetical protein